MSSSCIVCGASIAQGILCAKCDRPRPVKATGTALAPEIETASTINNILVAAGVPAVVLGADRSVKFVTEELKVLVGDARSNEHIKSINDVTKPVSMNVLIHDRKMLMSVVPLASGAAVIFRQIIDAHHARIDATMNAVRPQVRLELDAANGEIDKILTPQQREQFKKMRIRVPGPGGRRHGPPPF